VTLYFAESILVVAAVKSVIAPVCVENDILVRNLVPPAFAAKLAAGVRFHMGDSLAHLEIAIDHLREF
jgi:uncharacterized membrane protein